MRGYDNVKVIALFTLPSYSLHSTRPITKIEDLKGLKVRSTGACQGGSLTALGATPVGGITIPQVLEALSRGVIQGTVADFGGMVAFRYDAVTKHHFDIPMGTASTGLVMNREVYDGLPANVRAVIDKHSGEAMSRTHGVVFDKLYSDAVVKLRKDPTHKFVKPAASERAAIRKRLQPITDLWMSKDPDNKKRYDALVSIIEDIRKGR